MKYLSYILIFWLLFFSTAHGAAFPIGVGGTGTTSITSTLYPLTFRGTYFDSTSSPTVLTITATSTTATSTFNGPMNFTNLNLAINGIAHRWPSADGSASQFLQTDGSGQLSWAAGGVGTINSGTTNRLSYYSGATTLDSFNGVVVNAANGSSTWPTLNIGTLTATSGTSYLQALTLGTKLANSELANSTISGIALGGTLANLTATDNTLTFSGTYTGATARTIGLNLNSQNTWTASSTWPVLNTGVINSTSTGNYLGDLTLGVKLPNSQLANSSVTLNTTSPLGGGGVVSLGGTLTFTCTTCSTATINSGTANRVAVYSGATTLDSSNLIGALGSGSTTIPSNLTVSSIFASSTARITGALTLDTALTVANGGTGATTFTSNGVLYGNGAGAILVTAQGPANSVLTANAGAPSFSASPTLTNLTVTASTTFSGAASLFTFQGTTYFGGTVGIATTSPTFGLTVGNPNSGLASSSPLAPECRWVVDASFTLNLAQCVNSSVTAAANITITFSNIRAGVAGSVNLCQDGTGGRAWTWDNSLVRFMNASSSGITQTPNRCNLVGFKGVFATGTAPVLFMIPSDAF